MHSKVYSCTREGLHARHENAQYRHALAIENLQSRMAPICFHSTIFHGRTHLVGARIHCILCRMEQAQAGTLCRNALAADAVAHGTGNHAGTVQTDVGTCSRDVSAYLVQ